MIWNIIKLTTFSLAIMVFTASTAQYKPEPVPPQMRDSINAQVSRIIFKIDPSNGIQSNQRSASSGNVLENIREKLESKPLSKVFNNASGNNTRTLGSNRLDNIYEVSVTDKQEALNILKQLNDTDGVAYAELYQGNNLLYIPNDPLANPKFGNQYHLENIEAYNAWGIEQGDSSIVIAIVDTGIDPDHSDLAGNLAYNYNDPVNGIDDDGDGYVDNYMGWDISDDDNDPNAEVNGHGTAVTGMSSAHTNNNDGIAGTGFNSRFLPVKILADGSNKLVKEYEGIVYAADHGAKVINLSWGGAWNYSKFGKDVVDYAVLDKDVVVVAAAGNTHDEIDFYPASYENVLSVGASSESDELATWATYSYKIDLLAPGHNVFTTKNNDKYGNSQGSSFAAPTVAGAAALVRSKFPHLDARQVMEQLRVTTDDVYDKPFNQFFEGKLGKGRLNMYRAVTDSLTPSVRIHDLAYETNFGDKIFAGDTITIYPSFINYLYNAKDLKITLKPANSLVTGEESVYEVDNLTTYSTYSGVQEKGWKVVVDENAEPGSPLVFKVEFESGDYQDFEYFQLYTAPSYFDVDADALSLTVTSDGDLGYDNGSFYYGNGLRFEGNQLASSMGIMISKSNEEVLDNVVYSYNPYAKSQDFRSDEYLKMYNNSTADTDTRSAFREYEKLDKKIGVDVEQKVLSWEETGSGNYMVLEYRLVNKSDSALNNVNLGVYIDWDIADKFKNTAGWDNEDGIAWASSNDSNPVYTGMSLLTSGSSSFYAVDLDDKNGNTADFGNYFEEDKKFELSTSGLIKTEAGLNGGNDIAHLLALNDIDIASKGSKKVAFVITASQDQQTINDLVAEARLKYQAYLDTPPVEQQYFTCKDNSVEIAFDTSNVKEFYADPALMTRLDSSFTYTTSSVVNDTAYYFVNLEDGTRSDVRTIQVKLRQPDASFKQSTDTLFIENTSQNKVSFLNTSETTTDWFWDFGNGFQATVENPSTQYNASGNYDVMLVATNDLGCVDTVHSNVYVAVRSERPQVSNQLICKGTSTIIQADNTNNLRIYADEYQTELLYEGASFTTDNLDADKLFYVTNVDGWESNPVKVNIKVSGPKLDFEVVLDTTNLDEKHLLHLQNTSEYALLGDWIINDVYRSSNSNFELDYSMYEEVNIMYMAEDSLQCTDSLMHTIEPAVSQKPADLEYITCNDQEKVVRPGDVVYYFYADASLNNLLHKGKALKLDFAGTDTTIYYTAVDQYLESQPATITVKSDGLEAKIDVRASGINLTNESEIMLTDVSDNADWSYWYLRTGTIDTNKVLVEQVSNTGNYTYMLIAGNKHGCVDTTYTEVKAELITALDEKQELSVYPNPAVDHFDVKLGNSNFVNPSVALVDMKGNYVLNERIKDFYQNRLSVNTTDILPGIYLVVIKDENIQFQSRIAIKH